MDVEGFYLYYQAREVFALQMGKALPQRLSGRDLPGLI